MSRNPRISQLSAKRSLLKDTGQFREAIPLQLEIIELMREDDAADFALATAHNMASVLYLRAQLYWSAEWHARQALALRAADDSVKGHEALGTYHIVMARILACRFEFAVAVDFGRKAIAEFSRFHHPPDEFLAHISAEVEAMRNRTWAPPE